MRVIHLVREVMDAQLVDVRGHKMGRVDGLVLEVGDDEAPRVAAMLVSGTQLAARIAGPLARVAVALRRGWNDRTVAPMRIAFGDVREIGREICIELEATGTRAMALEEWLREHIVRRLPFA